MAKFFVEQSDIEDEYVYLHDDNANHITNVLRLKSGDEIEISSGDGFDYLCELYEFSEEKVSAKILDCVGNESEPNVKITLYQGIPKSEKMELIIQKCVELGIDKIVPVSTDRSIVKLNGKEEKKISRWNKISESASKQSKRGKIPIVEKVLSFQKAVEDAKLNNINIIPYEKEQKNSLKNLCKTLESNTKRIGVFIGPEGGFSDKEVNLAIDNDIIPVTLGKRILRTETAGFVTTTILLYELEDIT